MAYLAPLVSLDGPPKATGPIPARISAARLAIIDANRAKAELMHYFCVHHWGFDVVAFEHTGQAGIAAVAQTMPELVLAALTPTDMAMNDFVGGLRAAAPATKLILLTSHCNEYLVHALSGAGYNGLIWEMEEGLASLGARIERVRDGARVVSHGILHCQAALRDAPNAFPKLLSTRHQEVLVCIAHSMSDEEIARQLGVSVSTALSHRQKIMRKLNIHNTPKLIQYCIEKGFSSVPPPTPLHTHGLS